MHEVCMRSARPAHTYTCPASSGHACHAHSYTLNRLNEMSVSVRRVMLPCVRASPRGAEADGVTPDVDLGQGSRRLWRRLRASRQPATPSSSPSTSRALASLTSLTTSCCCLGERRCTAARPPPPCRTLRPSATPARPTTTPPSSSRTSSPQTTRPKSPLRSHVTGWTASRRAPLVPPPPWPAGPLSMHVSEPACCTACPCVRVCVCPPARYVPILGHGFH